MSNKFDMTVEEILDGKKMQAVADECGLSISYVSRVLNGQRLPRIHVAKAMANAIGVTLDEFYEMTCPVEIA